MDEKAIIAKWECVSCGAMIEKAEIFIKNAKGTKFSFTAPKKCSCDNKENFNLVEFEPATAKIVRDAKKKE